MWTQFWDMHSGGGTKEDPYQKIYIQAPVEEAKIIFYNRFGHNPDRVTCTCCGEDYSISEDVSLEQLTGYHRNCAFVHNFVDDGTEAPLDSFSRGSTFDHDRKVWTFQGREIDSGHYVERAKLDHMKYGKSRADCEAAYQTLEQYAENEDVLFIWDEDIKDEERKGKIPQQGYVWMD